ncbi:MAG: ABC-F family ATP-binding cassette domain-containing protein [Clostridia bacterium]|nr:ABC-F family ATP-binding cassette domain-containing protein [Clostridia bacterium]
MLAISLENIGLSFGADDILKNVSFGVNDGDRVGIIGSNGAGKTSLFKVIAGEYSQSEGGVYVQKGYTVGMLEQNPNLTALPQNLTAIEYMYTAHPTLLDLEERIARTEAALAEATDENEILQLTSRLNAENGEYARLGGLEFRSRCRGMLLRLGFEEDLIERKIANLSGGQYTRLALARLLSTEPDILMLDEPTNHLDIDALSWLENYIAGYKKTVLIISHDRYFLDRTTNKTLWIRHNTAKLYNGSYSACKAQSEAEAAALERRYKEQQKVIARIRANIEFQRRCNREHNFVTIRAKEKQLERMDKIELAPRDEREIRLSFNLEENSANDVILARGVGFSYGEKEIFSGLDFLVRRYERVLFLGKNGCGKSTLMKLINSRLTPTEGSITLGYNIKIGYYDQENRGLSDKNTVFEELRIAYPDKPDLELRSTLALFLFDADDIQRPIGTLSGGERARVTLAKLILKKVNLLVLDEPTNHLDVASCEALEDALDAFDGTIVAVSHDRYFINRIATRIIELTPGGERPMLDYSLEEGDSAFDAYLALREKYKMALSEGAPKKTVTTSKQEYEDKKREAAKERQEERRRERARSKIDELENEIERLDNELFGEAAADYVRASEIEARKAEIEEELLSLYEIVM